MSFFKRFLREYALPPAVHELRRSHRKRYGRFTTAAGFLFDLGVPPGLKRRQRLPSFWPAEADPKAAGEGTLIVLALRLQMLQVLPPDGTVAEIGTFDGQFARLIADVNRPATLHLIDPWRPIDDPTYPVGEATKELTDANYARVRRMFSREAAKGAVVIHREFSHDAAGTFPDGHFDWVYIDGSHTYEAVLNDLRLFAPKVKPDGFVCGHDYADNPEARDMGFGVIEAVNRFVRESEFRFTALFADDWPSFVLGKSSAGAARLRAAILANFDHVVELHNLPEMSFSQLEREDNTRVSSVRPPA